MKDRLDEFYFSLVGGLDEYRQLCKVIKMVLTLFRGQASVERGFNIKKAMLQPNLMSKSLTSQRLGIDHMKAHNSSAESVVITKQLRDSVKRAQNQQRTDLAERKNQESNNAQKYKRYAIITYSIPFTFLSIIGPLVFSFCQTNSFGGQEDSI